MQFQLRKIGHVVLNVTDLERAVAFYTGTLGLKVSDRYPDAMVPGGMVFLRVNTDHHGVALVGGAAKSERTSLNHFAFEVGSVDEVFRARAWLARAERADPLRGPAPRRLSVAIEFQDPDGNNLEIYCNIDQVGTEGTVAPRRRVAPREDARRSVGQPGQGPVRCRSRG